MQTTTTLHPNALTPWRPEGSWLSWTKIRSALRWAPISLLFVTTAALVLCQPVIAVLAFAAACALLERQWWQAHPEIERSWRARWRFSVDFYSQAHTNRVNQGLHMVANPLIWTAAILALFAQPFDGYWWTSCVLAAIGIVGNAIGHIFFEPGATGYTVGQLDMLSPITAVLWDIQQLRALFRSSPSRNEVSR